MSFWGSSLNWQFSPKELLNIQILRDSGVSWDACHNFVRLFLFPSLPSAPFNKKKDDSFRQRVNDKKMSAGQDYFALAPSNSRNLLFLPVFSQLYRRQGPYSQFTLWLFSPSWFFEFSPELFLSLESLAEVQCSSYEYFPLHSAVFANC